MVVGSDGGFDTGNGYGVVAGRDGGWLQCFFWSVLMLVGNHDSW